MELLLKGGISVFVVLLMYQQGFKLTCKGSIDFASKLFCLVTRFTSKIRGGKNYFFLKREDVKSSNNKVAELLHDYGHVTGLAVHETSIAALIAEYVPGVAPVGTVSFNVPVAWPLAAIVGLSSVRVMVQPVGNVEELMAGVKAVLTLLEIVIGTVLSPE
jgi:hypothetical protein